MQFKSMHIRGAGRGKNLGFPTINLEIPKTFDLEVGIYAVWVIIDKKKIPGAMHYGPIPSFGDLTNNLEIYILDSSYRGSVELIEKLITVSVVKRLRNIVKFDNILSLQTQIKIDIAQVRNVLGIDT